MHSCSELVLYPWDHAPTQTTDPAQRFTTLPSGTCQPIQVRGYQEYMPPRDVQRFTTVAQRVADAIAAVRGRVYTPQASIALYPTTGTQSDYAYSRHIADPAKRKVFGYTLETGPSLPDVRESFHPSNPDPIKEEAESGLLALVQQCICAIELIGFRLLARDDEVVALRKIRDEFLSTTEAGRDWIALFERVQTPLIGVLLDDDDSADAPPAWWNGRGSWCPTTPPSSTSRSPRTPWSWSTSSPTGPAPESCGVTSPRWRAGCACRAARVPARSSKG